MLLNIAIGFSAVSLAALAVHPVSGLALLFISKPVIDTTYAQPVLFGLKLTELVGGLAPLLVLLHLVFAKPEASLGRMPLKMLWLLYVADAFLFSSFIVQTHGWRDGANVFFRYLNGFVGFYMVQAFFHERRRLRILLLAIVVAGLFPMSVGVYQMVTGAVWKAEQSEGIGRNIGLYHDAFTTRAYSFQTILALLLYGALYASSPAGKSVLAAYLGVASGVLLKVWSKAGLLTLALWCLCWTVLRRSYGALAALVVVGVSVVAFTPGWATGLAGTVLRLFNKEVGALTGSVETARTLAGRWYGWQEMADAWLRLPWPAKLFGSGEVGLGAHNDYLQMLYHGGLLGLAIYLLLLGAIGVRVLANVSQRADPLGVAGLMLYLMWLVDTLGLVPSAYPGYQWFVWGIIGLSLRLREDERTGATAVPEPDSPRADPPVDRLLSRPGSGGRRHPIVSLPGARATIGAAFLLVILGLAAPEADGATFSGKRAIFDEDVLWTRKEYVDLVLARVKQAGFNVYVPCVWHGRGATWPSAPAPWDVWLKDRPKAGFDPLRYVIEQAHAMGIEVHPMFTIALRQAEIFPEHAPPGTPEQAFDMHDQRFHRLMGDLVQEVVTRYDVDGVNLDYVRAIGICTSASCKQEYRRRYGRDLAADALVFKATPGLVPTLREFQEEAVTAMVKAISDRVRQRKPRVLISVDAIPDVASPDQGQNSIAWVNDGLVDVLFRMDYYRRIDDRLTESIRTRLRNPDALTLLISNVSTMDEMRPGQKHFARDGQWLAETVTMIQRRWPATGVGVYLVTMLNDEQLAALRAGPFRAAVAAGRAGP